jgi:F-type H+-transporting ATPase subunit b
MLIDWFTVGAQALNFLILIWLMKHFLYQPILNAIEAREKGIAAGIADAASKNKDAGTLRDDLQKKNREFDNQRAALVSKAEGDAKAERDKLMDQARKDGDGLRQAQDTSLRNDRARLGAEIARLARNEVFQISRKALADLATVSLEERMGEVFTRRLRQMDDKSKAALGAAIKTSTSTDPAVVKSAFDLPAEQRAAIQNALNETFSADVKVRFETAPEVECGIELTANGQKVGWSIADYLKTLEQKADQLLEAQARPNIDAQAKPKAAAAAAAGTK